jgi:hypothetical protein
MPAADNWSSVWWQLTGGKKKSLREGQRMERRMRPDSLYALGGSATESEVSDELLRKVGAIRADEPA